MGPVLVEGDEEAPDLLGELCWGVVLVCGSTLDVAVDQVLKKATKAEKKEIADEDKEIRKALDD